MIDRSVWLMLLLLLVGGAFAFLHYWCIAVPLFIWTLIMCFDQLCWAIRDGKDRG